MLNVADRSCVTRVMLYLELSVIDAMLSSTYVRAISVDWRYR